MTDAPPPPEGSSPGGRGAWLTRRQLLWGCGVLAPIAALVGTWTCGRSQETPAPPASRAPPSAEALRHIRQAVWAATAGQGAQARTEAAAALALAPENAPTLLVLACVALEEGNVREAEGLIARLKLRIPARNEALLLERLLAHRQRVPTPGWTEAFRGAWFDAGRPDLERTHLLARKEFDSEESGLSDEVWLDTESPRARLFLTLAARPVPPARARWLLEQLPGLKDPGLFVAVANVLFEEELPARLRAQATAALRQRLTFLAEAHPRSMQLQLLRRLADTHEDTPLTTRGLEDLEPLLALPVWRESSFLDVFLEARRHVKAAGLPDAGWLAYGVANLSIKDRGSYLLRKRARTTRSHLLPGARRQLGRVVHAVGTRMAEQSTMLEHMLGLGMMSAGAEDMQSDAQMAQADALLDEAHAAEGAWRKAAVLRWPLHALTEETWEASARDEMAYLRTFLAPAG